MKHLSIINKVKLGLLVSLTFILTPQVSFSNDANSSIIILNTTGTSPLNDQNMKGYVDMIAAEAFKRIGITLKTVSLPAERGLINSNSHKVDGEMTRIAGLENKYKNLLQVPEKLVDWDFVAIGKSKLNNKDSWQRLSGKRVAFINGWKILEKNISPIAEVTKVKGPKTLFNILKNNRSHYIIYERWASAKYIQDLSLKNIYIQHPPLAKREMFIYLHKEHAQLVDKLAAILKNMKTDGTYKKLKNGVLRQYINH